MVRYDPSPIFDNICIKKKRVTTYSRHLLYSTEYKYIDEDVGNSYGYPW